MKRIAAGAAISLALAGCGSGGDGSNPPRSADDGPQKESSEAVESKILAGRGVAIVSPHDGDELTSAVIVVRGTAPRGAFPLTLTLTGDDSTVERDVYEVGESGRWRARVRLLEGYNS